VARAKQTNRAEARRRYRQATQADDMAELEEGADAGEAEATAAGRQAARPAPAKAAPTGPQRPGFLAAFRGAYHPAHLREDLAFLPKLLTSRALLAGILLVLAGAGAALAFPGYTGSQFALELLVIPGSALAPQLVAGFFAPRASYMLGFIVGVVQGVAFALILSQIATQFGIDVTPDQMNNVVIQSFVTGPVSGALFSAAAAWYRRFLALSSPRRAQQSGRPGAKPAPKRAASRR
jgi:hypothetical protein